MAELQRSAALRAAKMNPRGGNILIRRGLAMCGEAGPVAILAVVWRWIERIEELEREFMFWLERMPNAHRVVVLTHAIERLECALRVAHRRMGRRWDGRP